MSECTARTEAAWKLHWSVYCRAIAAAHIHWASRVHKQAHLNLCRVQVEHLKWHSAVWKNAEKKSISNRCIECYIRAIICWKSSMQSWNPFAGDFMLPYIGRSHPAVVWIDSDTCRGKDKWKKKPILEMTLAKERCDNGRWKMRTNFTHWKWKD